MTIKKFIYASAIALMVVAPMSSQAAGLRFGLKVGTIINSMSFSDHLFDASNRGGFAGGAMIDVSLPVTGIGVDASLMYIRRSNTIYHFEDNGPMQKSTIGRSYLDIPVNLKWNIAVPVIGKFISPYLATGPDFSFLLSRKNVKKAWRNDSMDLAWNFGFGVTILNHLQLGATYGLGITNSGSPDASLYGDHPTNAKNRFWVVTAAYLF